MVNISTLQGGQYHYYHRWSVPVHWVNFHTYALPRVQGCPTWGGMGGTIPHEGAVPPHQSLSPPIQKNVSPPQGQLGPPLTKNFLHALQAIP